MKASIFYLFQAPDINCLICQSSQNFIALSRFKQSAYWVFDWQYLTQKSSLSWVREKRIGKTCTKEPLKNARFHWFIGR